MTLTTLAQQQRQEAYVRDLIVLFSVIMSMCGCLNDMGEQLPGSQPANAESISRAAIQGRTVSFLVVCTLPTPCWEFVRSEHSIAGPNIAVTVFARPLNSDPCIQVLSHAEAPATIVVPTAGKYTFHFWRYGNNSLDTTLTFQ
jgi:hypothetical protein